MKKDLPRGKRINGGGIADFFNVSKAVEPDFNGVISLFIKLDALFFEGKFLLREGSVIAASLIDTQDNKEVAGQDSLYWIFQMIPGSEGDVDIYTFNEVDMRLSVLHNRYAFLDEPVELKQFLEDVSKIHAPHRPRHIKTSVVANKIPAIPSQRLSDPSPGNEKFKKIIWEWTDKGYNVEPLEKALRETDSSRIEKIFEKFEFDVTVLQRMARQINSFDPGKFKDEITKIRMNLKDTTKIAELMDEVAYLEKVINSETKPKPAVKPAEKSEPEHAQDMQPEKEETSPEDPAKEAEPEATISEEKTADEKNPTKTAPTLSIEVESGSPTEPVSKKDAFARILRRLQTSANHITAVSVITKNGLPVALSVPRDINVDALAGMSAAIYGSAETTIQELNRGNLSCVYTEANDSTFVVVDAGPMALLVALISIDANLGLVLVKLKDAAEEIKQLMG